MFRYSLLDIHNWGDGMDNLIKESTFRAMLTERVVSFLKNDTYSERDVDIIHAVVDIVCGVLADIPKIKG